jgi:hypothetical protein
MPDYLEDAYDYDSDWFEDLSDIVGDADEEDYNEATS